MARELIITHNGKEHVMQGTVAGFPVTICGLCMDDCICDPLRKAFQRGREYQQKRLTNHDMHSGLACLTNYEQGQRDEREACIAAVEAEKDAVMADAINEGTLINGAALSAFRLSLAAIRAREEKP